LNGILGQDGIKGMSASQNKTPYFQIEGKRITRRSDSVVANFENNAMLQAKQLDPSHQKGDLKFSGFKFWLGKHSENDGNNQEIAINTYLRIIIDWNDQAHHVKELSVYRAAIAISQVPAIDGDRPPREMFYRFLPNRSPFQMLACVPPDTLAI
jgi:hypothetical protein